MMANAKHGWDKLYPDEANLGGMTDDIPYRQEMARQQERDEREMLPGKADAICAELAATGRVDELREHVNYARALLRNKEEAQAKHRGPDSRADCCHEAVR